MACPDCASTATTRRKGRTALGYRRFRCQACRRRFNERTGTPFNDLQYPTDIVLLAVLWRLRYKLGFRDVAELLLQRGFEVTHETIRAWEVRFAPLLADQLRAKRRGQAGGSWYLDETYVKVAGRWCYLDRARATSVTLAAPSSTSSTALYRCSTSPNSTSMAASSAADGIVHREGPSSRTRKRSQVSPGYRSQCRLGTGAASAKCRAGTGARVSPSYRNLTSPPRSAWRAGKDSKAPVDGLI